VGFLSKYIADVKKGMAESAAEHGVAERKQRERERRRRDFEDPVKTLTAEREADKKLLDDLAGEYEELQAERDQLKAERDEAQAELADNKETLAGLVEHAEQLQAERDQFAKVLKGPGVRKKLIDLFHSDPKAARMSAAEREAIDKFMGLINAAYDLIKKIDKEAAAQAAAAKEQEADGEE
jgi:chromosome segregation ATPase